jgi:hypothetical protein
LVFHVCRHQAELAVATEAIGSETLGEHTMDALTAFGLFAVTAMLVCYALEDLSPWFVLSFAGHVRSDRPTDFFRVHGRLAWLKRSGP